MARTIDEIQQAIIVSLESESIQVSGSRTSIRRLWTYIVATAIYVLETLFDQHQDEVSTAIAQLKPHSLLWYREKAKAFRYGYALIAESDQYDDTGLTPEQIEDSQIIKYSAVTEAAAESRLVLKIATEADGELAPISVAQKAAFLDYIASIKDAGVPVTVINYLPDRLYLDMTIYYDPLVLDDAGVRIIDATHPVEDAIKAYLKNLPFNGVLILASLVDALQAVPGVVIPHIATAQSSWINPLIDDYGTPQPINVYKVPESGYFAIVNFDNISYVPYA